MQSLMRGWSSVGDDTPKRQLVGSGRAFFLDLLCVRIRNTPPIILRGSDLPAPVLEDAAMPKEVDSDSMPIPEEVRR